MANNKLTLLLLGFLTACGGGSPGEGPPPVQPLAQVGDFRQEVMSDLGLSGAFDQWDATLRAREFLFRANSPVTFSTVDSHTFNRDYMEDTYHGIKKGERIHTCVGLAFTLKFMLNELGIKSRVVVIGNAQYFGAPGQPAAHTLNEVYINGRWIAVDALFNTVYHVNGSPVSVSEMVGPNAKSVTWVYGTAYDNPERTIERYYGTLDWMLYGWLSPYET